MQDSLSIRSYNRRNCLHIHDYHQLVLPTQGNIQISVPSFSGTLSVGECLVIKAGQEHVFQADEAARFVVADLRELPSKIAQQEEAMFAISAPLKYFLNLVEQQLAYQVNETIEGTLLTLFLQLLNEQGFDRPLDRRIRNALDYMEHHLSMPLTIDQLADVAHLSPTQFKKLFKLNLGVSPIHFLTVRRMEKAKALLTHSDLPIQHICEAIGYQDMSAFRRRFRQHFGLSPSSFQKRL